MQLSDASTERVATLLSTESSLSFYIVAACVIVSYATASGCKQSFTNIFRLCCGYKSHQFYQGILFGFQHAYITQSYFLSNLEVHPSRSIVQVGMCRVDHDIILDCFHDTMLYIVPTRDGFISFEYQRMMGYDKIVP